MTAPEGAIHTGNYGETIRFEDGIYDLGAVADDTLFYLREELERYQACTTFYYTSHHRDEDAEALEFIEDEIYWRYRNYGSLDEDLGDRAVRCGLGCCYD